MLQVAKSIRPIRRVGEKSECHHRVSRPRKPSSGQSFRSPKSPGYGVLELCLTNKQQRRRRRQRTKKQKFFASSRSPCGPISVKFGIYELQQRSIFFEQLWRRFVFPLIGTSRKRPKPCALGRINHIKAESATAALTLIHDTVIPFRKFTCLQT